MAQAIRSKRESGARRARAWLLLLVSGLCLLPGRSQAQSASMQEYALKAAFLYNIAKYTDWPPGSFSKPGDPIIIGVLGDDPFGEVLDRIVQGRLVNDRPVIVRRASGVSQMKGAHLVFISPSESRPAQLCSTLESFHILTVGDTEEAAPFTSVSFAVEGDKIVFSVDLARATRAGVIISSKLLHLAKAVKHENETASR